MLSAYDEVQHMLASQLPNAILLRLYLNQVHSHSIRSLSQQLHPVSELMHQDQSYKLCIYGAIHNIIYIYITYIVRVLCSVLVLREKERNNYKNKIKALMYPLNELKVTPTVYIVSSSAAWNLWSS